MRITRLEAVKDNEDLYVKVESKEQLEQLLAMYREAGMPFTRSKSELKYYEGGCYVKWAKCLGHIWVSPYDGGFDRFVISFKTFVSDYCDGFEPVEIKLPKLYDKQVLKLAALIGVQDSLVEQLKANGAAIKALKAEMGVA